MPSSDYNLVRVNNVIIRHTNPQNTTISLSLPVVLDLYRETNIVKEMHQHMMSIYKEHNATDLENDLSFWQILLHNFFVSVLCFGARNGILNYRIKKATIDIWADSPTETFELLNMAQEDIRSIVGNGNKTLSKNEVLEKVYKLMDLQIKKYGKRTNCGLECSEESMAENLKNMVCSTQNRTTELHNNTNRFYTAIYRYLEWSKSLFFSFLVFVLVAALVLCALYFVPSVAFIFTFIETNMLFAGFLLVSGCTGLSVISTGLFMLAESNKSAEINQPFESGYSMPCRVVGQAAEVADNEQPIRQSDLLAAKPHETVTSIQHANDDQGNLGEDDQSVDVGSNTLISKAGMTVSTTDRVMGLEQGGTKKIEDSHDANPCINCATTTMLTNATLGNSSQRMGVMPAV